MFVFIYIAIAFAFNQLGIKGIFGGDSAEYSLIAQSWSIAHAPGYPLYSLLTNISGILFPYINEYVRINFFSWAPSILASFFIFRTLKILTKNTIMSFLASIYFLFLYPVWLYSEVPEVFLLNVFFISLATYIVVQIKYQKKNYWLHLAFILGLSAAHHHTFLFFIPGWIYILRNNLSEAKKIMSRFIFLFLMGALFYVYAPLASLHHPPLDVENAKSILGFINLVLRRSYGTFSAYSGSSPNILNQLFNLFSIFIFILHDFKPIGLLAITAGFIYLFKRKKSLFTLFFILFVSYLFFIFLTNFSLDSPFTIATYERFLIAFYYIFMFPFTYGFMLLLKYIKKINQVYIRQYNLRIMVGSLPYILMICLIGLNVFQSWKYIKNIPRITVFDRYAKDLLNTPETNSVVSIQGDTPFFTTAYYYYAKGYRKDIKYLHFALFHNSDYLTKIQKEYPSLIFPQNDPKIPTQFLKQNGKNNLIFTNQALSTGVWMPYGLLWKYYPDEDAASKEADLLVQKNSFFWSHMYKIPLLTKETENILYLQNVQSDYLDMYNAYGLILAQREEYQNAKIVFKDILHTYDENYINAATSLLEIDLIQKQCQEAQPIAHILMKNRARLHKEDLVSLLRYFKECDPKNQQVDMFIQDYKLQLKIEGIPLEKL